MSKKIIFIATLLVIIAGFVVLWMYRTSMFSKEILRLEIFGPDKVKAGDEIEYTIKYKNGGNFVLESPKLTFYMPDNSLTEDGKTIINQNLDDIYPGDEEVVKIKARLLGKEGDIKTAKAVLSYMPKNLTVRYESDTTSTAKIDSVPITLDFDAPTKAEKGKILQFSVNYFSNIDYPLENLSLRVNSVSGFDFMSSDPTSVEKTEWKLSTLNKAQGGRVTIWGNVTADSGSKVAFSAELGMWQNGSFVTIKQATKDVEVIQPLLYISQQVNGSDSYVASPGETLHYKVFFRNIGSSPFENLFLVVKLDSSALDMSSVQAENGQVQTNDNLIVWDQNRMPELKSLETQEEGMVEFYAKVKNDWKPSSSDANGAVITDEVNILQITQKFTIKVNSGLVISQSAYYKNSDVKNTGPIPPKVGEATTYLVTWNIQNYLSDAKNVKVKATLPQNVNLTGYILPSTESSNFSFDSASREIVWSAGDIAAGTGVSGDPYTISFQISLTPLPSQKGSTAQLIGKVQVTGENQFTNTKITSQDSVISTSLPDDVANSGGGVVQ